MCGIDAAHICGCQPRSLAHRRRVFTGEVRQIRPYAAGPSQHPRHQDSRINQSFVSRALLRPTIGRYNILRRGQGECVTLVYGVTHVRGLSTTTGHRVPERKLIFPGSCLTANLQKRLSHLAILLTSPLPPNLYRIVYNNIVALPIANFKLLVQIKSVINNILRCKI